MLVDIILLMRPYWPKKKTACTVPPFIPCVYLQLPQHRIPCQRSQWLEVQIRPQTSRLLSGPSGTSTR